MVGTTKRARARRGRAHRQAALPGGCAPPRLRCGFRPSADAHAVVLSSTTSREEGGGWSWRARRLHVASGVTREERRTSPAFGQGGVLSWKRVRGTYRVHCACTSLTSAALRRCVRGFTSAPCCKPSRAARRNLLTVKASSTDCAREARPIFSSPPPPELGGLARGNPRRRSRARGPSDRLVAPAPSPHPYVGGALNCEGQRQLADHD